MKLPIISRLHDSCIPLVFNVRQLPILFETSRYNFEAMILIEALSVLVALECEEAQTTVGILFRKSNRTLRFSGEPTQLTKEARS